MRTPQAVAPGVQRPGRRTATAARSSTAGCAPSTRGRRGLRVPRSSAPSRARPRSTAGCAARRHRRRAARRPRSTAAIATTSTAPSQRRCPSWVRTNPAPSASSVHRPAPGPRDSATPATARPSSTAPCHGSIERERGCEQAEADERHPRCLDRRQVQAQDHADGAEEQQQRNVGEHAAIVARLRFATEDEHHWLRILAPRQPVGRIPERCGCEREPDDARQARRHRIAEPPAGQADEQGAEPEWQRTVFAVDLAGDRRQPPIRACAVRHGPHDAEAGRVIRVPGFAADQASEDVRRQQADQQEPRNRSRGLCGHARGRRADVEHGAEA